jgi:hypothetical protein
MRLASLIRARVAIPIATAAFLGIFLGISSHAFDWSGANTLVVGGAFAVVLGLFGTPLLLLGAQGAAAAGRVDVPAPWAGDSVEYQTVPLRDFLAPTHPQPARFGLSFEAWISPRIAQAVDPASLITPAFGLPPNEPGSDWQVDMFNFAPALGTNDENFILPVHRHRDPELKITDFEFQESMTPVDVRPFSVPESVQLEPQVT